MKKELWIIVILWVSFIACQNRSNSSFNLGFEETANGKPVGWFAGSMKDTSIYEALLDSNIKHKGKYAVSIEYKKGKNGYCLWGLNIPNVYSGKHIKLSGFIRTKNIVEGYAGLWMRLDPGIALDDMSKNGVTGNTEWRKYEISLPFSDKVKTIAVGGLLAGKGKMWIDDLRITIDGTDITELKPVEYLEANADQGFDLQSKISIKAVKETNLETFYKLGLIWGFLKYYHPNIIRGKYNWDYELFRFLPDVINLNNQKEVDSKVITWINKFGKFKESIYTLPPDSSIKLNPDLNWIVQSGFSDDLQQLLLKIKNANRGDIEHRYYMDLNYAGGADLKNEIPYYYMRFPNQSMQLLALYRYWNIVEYFFPYKNLIGQDWKNILKAFIPKFINAKNELEYKLTLLELISNIHDSHGFVYEDSTLRKFFGENYAPLKLSFIEEKPVITGFYDNISGKQAGLKKGDIILTVNNKPVNEVISTLSKYIAASNQSALLRDIAPKLLRTNDSVIRIDYTRNNIRKSITLKTYSFDKLKPETGFSLSSPGFKWVSDNIVYLDNGKLKGDELFQLYERFKTAKALIIDLRNAPADDLMIALPNYIMPDTKPFVKHSIASVSTPGLFKYSYTSETGRYNKDYYKGKVILLVNENTQSSSEYHTMAYDTHPNSIIVGSNTAGADGDISEIVLPSGIKTNFSGIGVYYPDGRETQRIGIVPGVVVKPTIKGVIENRDEVLEKAIQLVN